MNENGGLLKIISPPLSLICIIMKKNIFIAALIAVIACFASSVNAQNKENMQFDPCQTAYYLKIASMIGNEPFTEVIKDGVPRYYIRTGWYAGLTGGTDILTQNDKLTAELTGNTIVGYQWRHWHTELRVGVRQFSYTKENNEKVQRCGLHCDAGAYYDFVPVTKNWNFYIGAFAGYQFIKYRYIVTECLEGMGTVATPVPYNGNSVRYGAELGITKTFHYTNTIGVYGRCCTYKYHAGETNKIEYNPVVFEVGVRLTFGLGRLVKP